MEIKIDKIIRSRRNTIALQLTDEATLIVRAPFEVSEETINRVVAKNLKWIEKNKNEILSRDPKFVKKEFVNGEGFLYLGKSYKLHIVNEQDIPLKFNNAFFLLKEYQSTAKQLFIAWYKKRAYEKISERVQFYAQKRGFKYNKIYITNANRRWGSCSIKGNLSFSWRLIMAPLSVIDYVIVHELAHLEQKNHSKFFWNIVRILLPEYEKSKDWLKNNGYMLRL
ncbi:MAG TPA: SprT family zinc-dependent metalloprotease [Spirochaetota bacterium]|mgnify:CR=1 FL=1|nr:SprT family zinc-dependent metalloprotease [Spirochaetota bacterium]HOM38919.1 SprT family zinc-dependent metalloprotease [Spirochaetota bacterium]HPQ49102.1 SprT family zinc-dependent metalloprotease [Spirochaetota bacterium]